MKKALSLLLSVLMIFSCMTVAVFAEDEATPVYYTIRFVDWDWDGSDETTLARETETLLLHRPIRQESPKTKRLSMFSKAGLLTAEKQFIMPARSPLQPRT